MNTPIALYPPPCRRTRQILAASLVRAQTPLALAHDSAAKPAHAVPTSDIESVRAVLMTTWDQPQARLVVDPIVLRGDVALAGWQQGDRGGRALLRKLAHAESTLDPKVLARFASFDGLVRMDEHDKHPSGRGASGHADHGTGHGAQTETPGGDHAQHPY